MRESSIGAGAVLAIVVMAVAGGGVHAQSATQAPAPNAAAPAVRAVYEAALRDLPFSDQQDFTDARRGFIATLPAGQDTRRYGVLACSRCGGRLRLIALIEQAAVIQRILRHLRLPDAVPAPSPARAPPLPIRRPPNSRYAPVADDVEAPSITTPASRRRCARPTVACPASWPVAGSCASTRAARSVPGPA